MKSLYSKRLTAIVCLWALIAIVVALSGILTTAPVYEAQALIAAQMFVFFAVLFLARGFRDHLLSFDLRMLTAFHVWRILPGTFFLYSYYALHRLPWSFAVPGGYGDIVVALTALPASLLARRQSRRNLIGLMVWHTVGFFDLAHVIDAGLVNGLRDPQSMRPLTHFPLSLLPTILVALTLMVHILAMAQIARGPRNVSTTQPPGAAIRSN